MIKQKELIQVLQTIFKQSHEGAILLDCRGVVLLINESARRLLGIPGNRRYGSFADIITPGNDSLLRLTEQALANDTETHGHQITYCAPRRKIELLISTRLLKDPTIPDGRAMIILFHELTKLWKLHNNERELLKQLRATYKDHYESLRQITQNIAHEVRNPIVSIGGYANLLIKKINANAAAPDEIKKYLHYILEESERLNTIVTHVERYSESRDITFRRENIIALFVEIFAYARKLAKRHAIDLDIVNFEKEDYYIYIDRPHMQETLRKLMHSIIVLAKPKSPITLRLQSNPFEIELFIDLHTEKISKENIHFIFDPFFSTPRLDVNFDFADAQRVIILHGGIIKISLINAEHLTLNLCFNITIPREKRNART